MDFESDLRGQVLAALKFEPHDEAELKAMHITELLAVYYNQMHRLIPALARKVHWSEVVRNHPQAQDAAHKAALSQIEAAFVNGTDLAPYLSRGIAWGYVGRKDSKGKDLPLNKRRHLDLLLSDWGLHHLHLTTQPEAQATYIRYLDQAVHMMDRDAYILLVKVMPEDAYFVDIIPHPGPNMPPQWAKEQAFRIMATEWPEAHFTMGVAGFTIPNAPSDQDRLKLRQAGFITCVDVAGQAQFSTNLMPTSGTPEPCVDASDATWRAMLWALAAVREAPDDVARWLSAGSAHTLADLDVQFQIFPDGKAGLFSEKTGVAVPLIVDRVNCIDGSWGFLERQSNHVFLNSVVQAAQKAAASDEAEAAPAGKAN